MEWLTFGLLLGVVLSGFFLIRYIDKYIKSEEECKTYKKNYEYYRNRVRELSFENMELQIKFEELNKFVKTSKTTKTEIPKGTIEAVKYAMIHNHPDNGGNAEKFILYKNCYDRLTGKS